MRLFYLCLFAVGTFANLLSIYGDELPSNKTCSAKKFVCSLFGHWCFPNDESKKSWKKIRSCQLKQSLLACPFSIYGDELPSNKTCSAKEYACSLFGCYCLPIDSLSSQAGDENKKSWKIHNCRLKRPLLAGDSSPIVGFLETYDLERYLQSLMTLEHDEDVRNDTLPQFSCVLVNFFDPNCPFSKEFAPSYSRLARLFPELHLIAVDVSRTIGSFSSLFKLGFQYGLVGTPTLVLLKDAKLAARLEAWEPINLTAAINFVLKHTDLIMAVDADEELDDEVTSANTHAGRENFLLAGAVCVSILCIVYAICQSSAAQHLWRSLRRDWEEMQESHQQQQDNEPIPVR